MTIGFIILLIVAGPYVAWKALVWFVKGLR